MKQMIILGVGMVGIGVGLYFFKCGVDVIIVDQMELGCEISYGNVGLIQMEVVEFYVLLCEIGKLFMIVIGIFNDVYYEILNLLSYVLLLFKYWWYFGLL